jgi:hypothetical protein
MPTHDYVIDNSTGGNVRADINLVLKAILTNNGGSTDPATVISTDVGSKAFSFWADTNSSPAVLKIRNAADNDWIELFQLDGTLTLEDGSASTPALAFRDDLNTGIFSSAADTFNVATGGVERMELGATTIFNEDGADVNFRIEGDTEANLFFVDAGENRIGIGTASPNYKLVVQGSGVQTILAGSTNAAGAALILDGDSNGDGSGSDYASITHTSAGHIEINNRKSAAIIFKTTSSETERARITSSGVLLLNVTSTFDSTSSAILQIDGAGAAGIAIDGNSTSSQSRASFFNPNGRVGSITTSGSATAFNTSSDYRLKENATAISDGITRIKTLKPYRFNFKSDATKTLDGFFAHEVTAVPEAITGTKDEVDSDNNPIYQGIDHSKLVPLLVACCQELITKVEALESA